MPRGIMLEWACHMFTRVCILVPRGRTPFGQHQESRPKGARPLGTRMQNMTRAWNALRRISVEKAAILNLLSKYPELHETLLKWFSEKKSQDKSFILNQNFAVYNITLYSADFVRLCYMYMYNVYTSRGNDCFWLVSFWCCQNKTKNHLNLASLIFHKNCC